MIHTIYILYPYGTPFNVTFCLLQTNTELGEVMFSLSYLPTAERLTVVLVKARNLKFKADTGDAFVKVYFIYYNICILVNQ